ncbi:hypothetical protein BD779DRAFT_1670397 [Infundibulicybe gibba]|nr:hypothetical protein BD779DRAFT_1670397 [Infundibulicybe gibba]
MIDETSTYASALTNNSSPATVGVPSADSEYVPPLVTSIHSGTAASFPLRFNHTESYIGEGSGSRTVLVGDAAHTIHPLAGQGLNLGLGDVKSLAHCIHSAVLHGSDIGSYNSLLPYTRERYFENHKIMSAIDKLHKLYSTKSGPIVWSRSVGLEVLNELDTLKSAIMMTAGATGRMESSKRWPLVVMQGIEGLVGGFQAIKAVEQGLGQVVAGSLREIVKQFSRSEQK